MTKFCKNCGSELSDGSVFCDECGAKVGGGSSSYGNELFDSYKIDMMNGEYVIRHSQIHVGCLYLPLAVLGFGIFLGFMFTIIMVSNGYFDFWFSFMMFMNGFTVIGLIWFIIRYIGYKTNDLILTNKRVFGKCGLISTTQMQAPLNKIDSVSFSNGPFGKLIGYGTVKIATTSSIFKFRFIREGQTLYNDIFNQLEVSEIEKRNENAKAIVDAMDEKLS
jgi:membrane protein YdbS with pleckstrin-like domain